MRSDELMTAEDGDALSDDARAVRASEGGRRMGTAHRSTPAAGPGPPGAVVPASPTEPRPRAIAPSAEPARAIAREHPDYPDGLRDLSDAPAVMYVRGEHSAAPRVRGHRRLARGDALRPARARRCCRGTWRPSGITVVSGLARGIDAAAHRGALEAGGATVAVLPAGLDHVTPPPPPRAVAGRSPAAARWSREIRLGTAVAAGRVRAPQPPDRRARRRRGGGRGRRRRAAHSATAQVARSLGRPVLAVPGDVDRPQSAGCLALLRDGARVCARRGRRAGGGRSSGGSRRMHGCSKRWGPSRARRREHRRSARALALRRDAGRAAAPRAGRARAEDCAAPALASVRSRG